MIPHADLYASARPVLRVLADLSRESATLHVRADDEAVLVLGAESDYELRRAAHLGSSTALRRGVGGQDILAPLPPDEATAILSRTGQSSSAEEVPAALAAIRNQGFSLSAGAAHPGLRGIAVPVLTAEGHPVASVADNGAELTSRSQRRACPGQPHPRLWRRAKHLAGRIGTSFFSKARRTVTRLDPTKPHATRSSGPPWISPRHAREHPRPTRAPIHSQADEPAAPTQRHAMMPSGHQEKT
ncbi:hypothetical protein E2651_04395 [Streptomyces sp. MZ04]|nr:hypothetical protein E2651_04395 [Streptomyces sp. MZ04]